MIPKEKAIELVAKYNNTHSGKMSDYSNIYIPTAKVCALICVEEIKQCWKISIYNYDKFMDYWEEVENEINKL